MPFASWSGAIAKREGHVSSRDYIGRFLCIIDRLAFVGEGARKEFRELSHAGGFASCLLGVKQIDDAAQPVVDAFPMGVPPHIFSHGGEIILDDALGFGHFGEPNFSVGASNTGLFEPSPGGFGKAMTHQVIIDGDGTSADASSDGSAVCGLWINFWNRVYGVEFASANGWRGVYDGARQDVRKVAIPGDSGRPCFLWLPDQLVLMFGMTYPGSGYAWAIVPDHRARIEAILAMHGESLTDADLSSYATYGGAE